MKKNIFCVLMLGMVSLYAGQAPVFYASFDEDYHGKAGDGTQLKGKHSQKELPALQPGVSGKAAEVGASEDRKQEFNVVYPAKNVLSAQKGSVSFWCKSLNWDTADKDYHVLFRARGGDAELLIYKVPDPMISFLIGPLRSENGKKIWTELRGKATSWKRDEWHFVTVTWGDGKGTLYLDGKSVRRREIPNMPGEFIRFGAGGLYPARWPKSGKSMIDELKIYDRVLTPEEVAAEYASGAKLIKK